VREVEQVVTEGGELKTHGLRGVTRGGGWRRIGQVVH